MKPHHSTRQNNIFYSATNGDRCNSGREKEKNKQIGNTEKKEKKVYRIREQKRKKKNIK